MPINVTPIDGLSDHINNVRSHTGPGVDGQMVTNESLRYGARGDAPDSAHGVLVATNVHHHYEMNESWGFSG
jgi:hypothetical protein